MNHESDIEKAMHHAAEVYGIMIAIERTLAVAQTHRVQIGEYIYRLYLN